MRSGGGTRGGHGSNAGRVHRGGRRDGAHHRDVGGAVGGGSSSTNAGTGGGSNGGGRGTADSISDEQAIHEFIIMLKEGGDHPSNVRAWGVQQNFEKDGNRERYIRQVRFHIKDRIKNIPPPGRGSSATGGGAGPVNAGAGRGATCDPGGPEEPWRPDANGAPTVPSGSGKPPRGESEPPPSWAAAPAGGVGPGHDSVRDAMAATLDGSGSGEGRGDGGGTGSGVAGEGESPPDQVLGAARTAGWRF